MLQYRNRKMPTGADKSGEKKCTLTSGYYNSNLDQSGERYWRDQINCSCAKKNQETI